MKNKIHTIEVENNETQSVEKILEKIRNNKIIYVKNKFYEDEDVLGILKTIDKIAPVDSVLACSEPWGDFYHRECWNIRPPEWWSDALADWEFEFYNDYILTDPPGRSKGFIAIKK